MSNETNREEEIQTDAIGDTVYSKKWLFACLLKTIQFAQSEIEQPSLSDNDDECHVMDMEEQLCLLWDMSADENVQKLLLENKGHEIFINCILKTNLPRFAEIYIGILGNMVHNDEICQLVSDDKVFCTTVISWLSSSDIPFLTQLIRFLNTILCKKEVWHTVISENTSSFFDDIQKLLLNCLNVDLLKSLFQLINQMLYFYNDLGSIWLQEDGENACISALCQACFQVISSLDITDDHERRGELAAMSPSNFDFFFHFWFIIKTLYEPEYFISKFESNLEDLKELFFRYDHFMNSSANSLLSYSASCSFFMSIFNLPEEVQLNDRRKLLVNQIQGSMSSNDKIFVNHKRALAECQNRTDQTEELQEGLSNLQEFCLLFSPRQHLII